MGYKINNSIFFNPLFENLKFFIGKEKKEIKKTGNPIIDSFRENKAKGTDKVAKIMAKFRAGKKLSGSELQYLEKNAPELYQMVRRIMLERKALEIRMEKAKTKEEVKEAVIDAMDVANRSSGGEERTMRLNQLWDAYQEYMKTGDYRGKPESEREDERGSREREETDGGLDIKV